MDGFLGGMFDFNGDGKLDDFERAADFAAFSSMMDEIDHSESEEDSDEFELEMAGLDRDELEFMDEDDRRTALEDAGLDPDDYDFD